MKKIFYSCPNINQRLGGFGNVSIAFYNYAKKYGYDFNLDEDNLDIGFMYQQPQAIFYLKNVKYKIGYCMFESTKAMPDWGEYLKQLDLLITPSQFAREIFLNQFGIDSIVIPHGINTDEFTYQERVKTNEFKLIYYNAFDLRKGHPELIQAFMEEFTEDEPVNLTLKTWIGAGSNSWFPNTNINVICEDIENRAEFLKDYDCMVFPTRGEGFGMTPLEAMATGIPAIIPNKTGLREYFNSKYCYEIDTYQDKAIYGLGDYDKHDLGNFEYCKIGSIREQMRRAYEDWKLSQNHFSNSKNISDYARGFSLEEATKQIIAIVDKIEI